MTKDEIKQLTSILAKIKTPKDIKALHDVRVMLDIIDCGKLLSNHLHEFKDEFVDSFAMTADEVLSLIPQSKWDKYKLKSDYYQFYNYSVSISFYSQREKQKDSWNHIRKAADPNYVEPAKEYKYILNEKEIAEKKAHIKTEVETNIPGMRFVSENDKQYSYRDDMEHFLRFEFKLSHLETLADQLYRINKTDRCFYINHKKKTIEMNWSLWTPDVTNITIPKGYNKTDYNDRVTDRQEFKKGIISLDNKKNIISYTCEFKEGHQFYIGRDSDWYSKRRTHEYEMSYIDLIVTHKFCMNTNTYLGCDVKENTLNFIRPGSQFSLYKNEIFFTLYEKNDQFDVKKLIESFENHLKKQSIIEFNYIMEGTEKDREKRMYAEMENKYDRKYNRW